MATLTIDFQLGQFFCHALCVGEFYILITSKWNSNFGFPKQKFNMCIMILVNVILFVFQVSTVSAYSKEKYYREL